MTPGRFVYLVWHRPIGAVKRSIREGGPVEQWITEQGRKEMEAAADNLGLSLSLSLSKNEKTQLKPLEVQVLTGKKYWYQTAFCLHSLGQVAGREIVPMVHDDGSLQPEQIEVFRRICPKATVESRAEIEERIERALPRAKFPFLRKRRDELP